MDSVVAFVGDLSMGRGEMTANKQRKYRRVGGQRINSVSDSFSLCVCCAVIAIHVDGPCTPLEQESSQGRAKKEPHARNPGG